MEVPPFIPYKLLLHRDRVEASLRGELVYPISVELDLSNKCPHDCPFCSFGTSASQGYRQQNWDVFPESRIFTLLHELKDCGVESLTFTGGGEPLVHPKARQVLEAATSLGFQWGIVTNGLLLTDRIAEVVANGATFVRVSLDAGSALTHMKTHGIKTPQYDQILYNLRRLRQAAPKLTLGASFCVMESNWQEIGQAAEDVAGGGGNYLEVRPTFPTTWRGDDWEGGLSPETMDQVLAAVTVAKSRWAHFKDFRIIGMDQRFQDIRDYKKPYSRCQIGPLTTVIGAEGSIWHCCVQRGNNFFKLGSVLDKPFIEAWAHIHRARDSGKIDVDRCPRGRYDGYNQIMEQAFQQDGLHGNFV